MLKKGMALIVSSMLAVSVFSSTFAASFSDVTANYDWAQDSIETLANEKIIEGYPDGTFQPGKNITKQEAIALFSRCLGSSESVNEPIVTVAYNNAEQSLAKYDSYALRQAAYLMYKKVLTEDDLVTYLSAANKDTALKRYEAAILIAKSLGGDVWLKSNPDVKTSFADADDIPASAQGYVYYASELGIIKGMDNNQFVPMGNVTRAQVAVMIHRILSMMQYTYTEWVIAGVDTAMNVITVRNTDGETEKYTISSGVPVMIDGQKSQLNLLQAGMETVLTFAHDSDTGAERLYSVDAVSMVSEDTLEGIYRGRKTENSGTTVTVVDLNDRTKQNNYQLAADAAVRYKGVSASLADFRDGDYVRLEIKSGKVAVIEGAPKTTTVENAIVEFVPVTADDRLRIRTTDNEIEEYSLASGASLRKNGAVSEFRNLAVGDTITLTLEYGQIKSAVASGVSKDVEGTIEEISISADPTIKVKRGDTSTTYNLSRDAKITLDDKAATIYDLRVGFSVKLKTSSQTVTELTVTSSASQRSVTGEITVVNTAYGMIKVNSVAANGEMTEQQVFIKDNAVIVDSSTSKILKIKDLEIGMTIMAAGSENVGIFEATSIMVLPAEK